MEQKTVHEALAAVLRNIRPVDKNGVNQAQKFKFRSIDDIMAAAHEAFAEHGVFCVPEIQEMERVEVASARGNTGQHVTLRCAYHFYGPAGDSVSAVGIGEAMDWGDKAVAKALAMAYKYVLLQAFAIPTESTPDPDAEAHEITSRGRVERITEKQRAQVLAAARENGYDIAALNEVLAKAHVSALADLPAERVAGLLKYISDNPREAE